LSRSLLIAGLASLAIFSGALAETPRSDLDAVFESETYQTDLPDKPVLDDVDPPTFLSALGPVMRLAIWIGIALIAILLIAAIVRHVQSRALERSNIEPLELPDETGGPGTDLATVERLAAEERYDEAIHQLLLLAIERLRTELSLSRDRSATSRELRARLPHSFAGRRSFSDLVLAVERSYFGGIAVSREDYRTHLSAFRNGAETV